MFARLNKKVRGSDGFTLIELLVVIIIIAILAAIAIPMYLSQRTKGWEANAQSDLRNAAVAEESYFTDNSVYAAAVADLTANGYNQSGNITMDAPLVSGAGTAYCLHANHNSGGRDFHFASWEGDPQPGACPAFP